MTTLSHVEFYTADARTQAAEFRRRYGFEVVAVSDAPGERDHFSVALRQGAIVLVLTEARSSAHPAASFVESHGDGVADITLRVPDARAAHAEAIRRGAQPWIGSELSIHAFGDVRHTFVDDDTTLHLPGLPPIERAASPYGLGLLAMDHFAVCLPEGELTPTVAFYESVLDMRLVFKERIAIGSQAMRSEVVQSADRTLTLTLIEPDPDSDPGQIDDFVKNHGGAGVQHIAFSSADAVAAVSELAERGVEFLQTPPAYYELLKDRLTLSAHSTEELRRLNLLVDEDQDGQLFQIFTRSTHPRRTLFFEIIERVGARTFGTGNIKALYQAAEADHIQSRMPS